MKDILLDIINNDTSHNKSATRYLYRSHPDLWEQILALTKFLPSDSKPKQRIWHIINTVNEIPKCPIANVELKWWENRYLTTSSRSARIKLQHQRGDFVNGHTPENNEKRRQGNLKAVTKGRKYRSKETYTDLQKKKLKKLALTVTGSKTEARQKNLGKRLVMLESEMVRHQNIYDL